MCLHTEDAEGWQGGGLAMSKGVLLRRQQTQEEAAGKQKKGKAQMREYKIVSIPQEAFMAALRMGEE